MDLLLDHWKWVDFQWVDLVFFLLLTALVAWAVEKLT